MLLAHDFPLYLEEIEINGLRSSLGITEYASLIGRVERRFTDDLVWLLKNTRHDGTVYGEEYEI